MLYLIDPDAVVDRRANPYDPSSNEALHYVAKQVNLGGRFFDLTITPAGDELTLEPSSIPIGHVTNPNKGYRAIVYGEQGFLKVVGDESGKAPLPVGEWKLASYTIDRTVVDQPVKDESQETSSFGALKRSSALDPRHVHRKSSPLWSALAANETIRQSVSRKARPASCRSASRTVPKSASDVAREWIKPR